MRPSFQPYSISVLLALLSIFGYIFHQFFINFYLLAKAHSGANPMRNMAALLQTKYWKFIHLTNVTDSILKELCSIKLPMSYNLHLIIKVTEDFLEHSRVQTHKPCFVVGGGGRLFYIDACVWRFCFNNSLKQII